MAGAVWDFLGQGGLVIRRMSTKLSIGTVTHRRIDGGSSHCVSSDKLIATKLRAMPWVAVIASMATSDTWTHILNACNHARVLGDGLSVSLDWGLLRSTRLLRVGWDM